MNTLEHVFWHDPKTQALQHRTFSVNAEMYTAIKHICMEHAACINMWNLSGAMRGWFTSMYNGGTTPTQTNLYKIVDDKVPADIKVLCLILDINWRTE